MFPKHVKWKNMFLASIWSFSHLRSLFLVRVIQFGETLGDQLKCRSSKKLNILKQYTSVLQLYVPVFRLKMILLSYPWRVPKPSNPIRRNFGRSGKGLFTEKAKIVNWGSQCSPPESTCSKLQYDPYLISVACSYTELSISVRFGRWSKG